MVAILDYSRVEVAAGSRRRAMKLSGLAKILLMIILFKRMNSEMAMIH